MFLTVWNEVLAERRSLAFLHNIEVAMLFKTDDLWPGWDQRRGEGEGRSWEMQLRQRTNTKLHKNQDIINVMYISVFSPYVICENVIY